MAKDKDYYILKKSQIRETKSAKSVLVKSNQSITKSKAISQGQIVATFGKEYIVEDSQSNDFFECLISGTLKSTSRNSSLAVVGDFVSYSIKNEVGKTGLPLGKLEAIEDRKSKLSRKRVGKTDVEQVIAANLDCVLIFFAAIDPDYNRRLIDRFLVTAEQNELRPVIVLNKTDLVDIDSIWSDFDVYRNLGISVHFISTFENIGIQELYESLTNQTSIITGPSGVGKSTFVNAILGHTAQMVNEISERTLKGQHTTSSSKLFTMENGGRIIDSPGLREFGLWELDKSELSLYFHDFDKARLNCKFSSCTHTHEPNCGVKAAYEAEEIDYQRYESYLNLYNTL